MNFKNKNIAAVIIIYLSILLIYVLAPILVPFSKGAASWIIYGTTIFSLAISFIVFVISFKTKYTIKSLLYGVPVFRIGVIYFALQVVASLFIFITDGLVGTPYWVSLICSIVLFALCTIGVSITDAQRRTIEKVEERQELKTALFDTISSQYNSFLLSVSDKGVYAKATSISEIIKYSDPISNDKSIDLEKRIIKKIENLKLLAEEEDWESTNLELDDLKKCIIERNGLVAKK